MLNLDKAIFIRINPAAESDRRKMNDLLKQKQGYIEGLEFTPAEQLEDGSVQFFYSYPDSLTTTQKSKAESLIKTVYAEFMSTRPKS